jgi:hypothetical protein
MVPPKPKSITLRGQYRRWRDTDSLKDRSIESEFGRLREALPVSMFGRVVSRIERTHLTDDLFRGRHWKTWQEAWIAWQFALADRATHLQLAEENADDDFYLKRRRGDWIGFQATEALLEGRQRSREYREAALAGREFGEVDDVEIRRESAGAIPAILTALEKKSISARNGHLVILWNTGWLIDARQFIRDLEEQSAPYCSMFEEAWMIGKKSLFKLAPNFQMLTGPPVSLRGDRS